MKRIRVGSVHANRGNGSVSIGSEREMMFVCSRPRNVLTTGLRRAGNLKNATTLHLPHLHASIFVCFAANMNMLVDCAAFVPE